MLRELEQRLGILDGRHPRGLFNRKEDSPREHLVTRPGVLPLLDWIVRYDAATVDGLLGTLASEQAGNRHYQDYLRASQNVLGYFGVLNPTFPFRIAAPEMGINTSLQKLLEMKGRPLGPFPKEIPLPVEHLWERVRLIESDVGETENPEPRTFLVLDLSLTALRAPLPQPTDNPEVNRLSSDLAQFLQLYIEYRTGFAHDIPLSIVFPLGKLAGRLAPFASDELNQKLYDPAQGVTREEIAGTVMNADDELGPAYFNRVFTLPKRWRGLTRAIWRQHGWMGDKDLFLENTFFRILTVMAERSGELDPTVAGLLATCLGNHDTYAKLIPGLRQRHEGSSTDALHTDEVVIYPHDYARQLMAAADFYGIWRFTDNIFDFWSMAAAAGFHMIDEIILRADRHGVDLPDVNYIFQNPAIAGVNIFLELWDGFVVDLGLESHRLRLSAGMFAPIIQGLSRLFAAKILPEAHARMIRLASALQFARYDDRAAIRGQTLGLRRQQPLSTETVARLNERRIPILLVADNLDKLTKAHRQWEGFGAIGLKAPMVFFDHEGHAALVSRTYLESFVSFYRLCLRLTSSQMADYLESFRQVFPTGRLPHERERPYGNQADWEAEIEEKLVPLWVQISPDPEFLSDAKAFAMRLYKRTAFPN